MKSSWVLFLESISKKNFPIKKVKVLFRKKVDKEDFDKIDSLDLINHAFFVSKNGLNKP